MNVAVRKITRVTSAVIDAMEQSMAPPLRDVYRFNPDGGIQVGL